MRLHLPRVPGELGRSFLSQHTTTAYLVQAALVFTFAITTIIMQDVSQPI